MGSDSPSFDEVLSDARWLLAGVDASTRELVFVETTREILLSSAFIDGRTPLSASGRSARVPFEEAVRREREQSTPGPDRVIAHVGFCGSSLLARLLDATGACLTYKEPQVLITLSDLKAKADPVARDARFPDLVAAVMGQLRKSFGEARAVVKPSIWPLNLIGDAYASGRPARGVLLSIGAEDYLVAVLRGGAGRIDYMLRFVSALKRGFPPAREAIATVEDAAAPQLEKILRFCLVAHAAQERELARVAAGLPGSVRLGYGDLLADPEAVLMRAGEALDAPLSVEAAARAVREVTPKHGKAPGSPFDRGAHDAKSAEVRKTYGAIIARALAAEDRRVH